MLSPSQMGRSDIGDPLSTSAGPGLKSAQPPLFPSMQPSPALTSHPLCTHSLDSTQTWRLPTWMPPVLSSPQGSALLHPSPSPRCLSYSAAVSPVSMGPSAGGTGSLLVGWPGFTPTWQGECLHFPACRLWPASSPCPFSPTQKYVWGRALAQPGGCPEGFLQEGVRSRAGREHSGKRWHISVPSCRGHFFLPTCPLQHWA